MASEVDIANLALARLGDDATVSSFNPPEGSAQADHCARFYPVARDSMLEMHDWGFATARVGLTQLTNIPPVQWLYSYAVPSDFIKAIAVTPPANPQAPVLAGQYQGDGGLQYEYAFNTSWIYMQQEYIIETAPDGTRILYTNQLTAQLQYIRRIVDTNLFSPLFVDALGWLLASYLAGPVVKGKTGTIVAAQMAQFANSIVMKASNSDSNNQMKKNHVYDHKAPWMRR